MREVGVYTRQLQAGTLSRRGFVNLVAGLGLGASAAGSIINSAFAATPKQGGHLRICFHNASQQIVRDDGGQVIPSFVNILNAAASRVKNPVTNPVSALEWIAESCWLEA